MIRRLHIHLLPLLCLALTLTLASCGTEDEPVPTPPAQEPAPCTLIIYMLANNSLGTPGWGCDYDDMDEITSWAKANSLGDNHLVIIYIPRSTTPTPQMLELQQDGSYKTVHDWDQLSTGTYATQPEVMSMFLSDTRNAYPARSYRLVLWSHGNAWTFESGTLTWPETKSWGDDRNSRMSIPALREALRLTAPWDIIYFDSCYAGNVETIYELRDTTPWIVASTTEIHADGAPYQQLLTPLLAEDLDATQVARTTFEYYDARTGSDRSCTMAAYRTEALDALAAATARVMAGATLPDDYQAIPYYYRTNPHTFDMAHYIHALQGVDEEALREWDSALQQVVAFHGATPYMWEGYPGALDLSHYCGLGSYILRSQAEADRLGYGQTAWYADVISPAL